MTLALLYIYVGPKNTRYPILKLDRLPSSWDILKDKLLELGLIVFNEFDGLSSFPVSLERILKGKNVEALNSNAGSLPKERPAFLVKKGTYRKATVHYRRTPEFSCLLNYNHLNRTIQVTNASFGPTLAWQIMPAYQEEMGKGFKVPPVLPRAVQNLRGNLEAIFAQPSDMTVPNYEMSPQKAFYQLDSDHKENQGPYALELSALYSPTGRRIFSEDEFEKGQA